MNVLFKYFMNNAWDIQAKQQRCKWASKKGAGARSSDRGIGLGFGGGYRKITDSTSHPRIHVIYDRDTDTMRISGAPGETEKAWDIIRRLDIEPELLLGY